MPFAQFKSFGRRIFTMYDTYPLLANSIVGGSVYGLSETIIQYNNSKEREGSLREKIDLRRVRDIGLLGSLENGVLMTTWYTTQNFYAYRYL